MRFLWSLGASMLACMVFAAPSHAQTSSSWWERLSIGMDFRQRLEELRQFENSSPDVSQSGVTQRRLKIRARLTLNSQVNDDFQIGVRLGTGNMDDPLSSNQTLSELLTRKPIGLDRAFMTYNPNAVPVLTIGVGKFGLPVTRTEMSWDIDVNWEGLYQQVRGTTGAMSYRFVTSQVSIHEEKQRDDTLMFATYGDVSFNFDSGHSVQFVAADYLFSGIDSVAIFVDTEGIGRNTNLTQRDNTGKIIGFQSDFNLIDLIAKATLNTGRRNYPLQLTANWITNTRAATEENDGFWFTATYGNADKIKTYQLEYTYAQIEQDAVVSTFTYSYSEGTNVRLNRAALRYRVHPRLRLDLITIFTKKLITAPNDKNNLLLRSQLDASFSF